MTVVIIALGSNRPHGRYGSPAAIVRAVAVELGATRLSSIYRTKAVGPGGRDFANAVILTETRLSPLDLLGHLKSIERRFGRRAGRAWGARVLDLDILAYGDAVIGWRQGRGLIVPHRLLHRRRFVLDPLVEVAPGWRHPVLNRTARQLRARLTAPRPRPSPPAAGP